MPCLREENWRFAPNSYPPMQCRSKRMGATSHLSLLRSPTQELGFLRTFEAASSIPFLRLSLMPGGLASDCRACKRSFASTMVISRCKALPGRGPLSEFSFPRRIGRHQPDSLVLLGNDLKPSRQSLVPTQRVTSLPTDDPLAQRQNVMVTGNMFDGPL